MAPCWTRAVKGKAGLITLPSREFGGLDVITSRKAPSIASCRNTPPPRTESRVGEKLISGQGAPSGRDMGYEFDGKVGIS